MENQHLNGAVLANGHAKMNGAMEKMEAEVHQQENIFLFIPNIIGMLLDTGSFSQADLRRLLPYCPGNRLALLHATSSKNMLFPLLCLLLA